MTQDQTATQELDAQTSTRRSQDVIEKDQGWLTLYKSSKAANHEVTNHGGTGSRPELEVEADGDSMGSIFTGQSTHVEAKKLRIRALTESVHYRHEKS